MNKELKKMEKKIEKTLIELKSINDKIIELEERKKFLHELMIKQVKEQRILAKKEK